MIVLSPEQTKKEEQKANESGLSYSRMMDNAANAIFNLLQTDADKAMKSYVILIGKGKNGGDGFVLATLLANAGHKVTVIKLFQKQTDALSKTKWDSLSPSVFTLYYPEQEPDAEPILKNADVIVDAVFGIGFHGALPEECKKLFSLCNSLTAKRVAVDVPSGLSFGEPLQNDIFCAHETVALLCLKPVHVYKPYSFLCGRVSVGAIGFAPTPDVALQCFFQEEIKAMLPKRPYHANKGTFGKGLLIAGSKAMPGASVIAARGALYSGIGLLTVMLPECNLPVVASHVTDCTFIPVGSKNGFMDETALSEPAQTVNGFSALAFGCGMGNNEHTLSLLTRLIKECKKPLIIDADGINALSKHMDILKDAECPVLLTPHPGEMARLTGKSMEEIQKNREQIALDFAKEHGVYLLLKGENTVIASPSGKLALNTTGAPALARGGSGDLLTGLILSFLCQGKNPFEALVLAAFLHGRAGEEAEQRYTGYCAVTQKLTECICDAFTQICKGS